MRLTNLQWSPYRVPFRSPFITAHGTLSHRSGALLWIQTESGQTGTGEIAPLPEFNGSSLTEVLSALPRLQAQLQGQELRDILAFLETRNRDNSLPAPLLCGLEIALLDALGQAQKQSLAQLLSARVHPTSPEQLTLTPRTLVAVNAVIGGSTTEKVVELAQHACREGFTCLKLKITAASQHMLERVAAVRSAIGPGPRLRLDANASWEFEEAVWMLTQAAPHNIQYVEQPLPASDLAGMARLRRLSPIPLAADEALESLDSAQRLLDAEAVDLLILKPQLIGGLRSCRKLIQQAREQQIACVITSTLETGIGVSAALHLAAASPEITQACGLATLSLLEADFLQERLTLDQGSLKVPTGPGLGVQVNRSVLEQYLER